MAKTTGNAVHTFSFSVDGKTYESNQQTITGEELRDIAGVPAHLRIFLKDHAPGSADQPITIGSVLDLAQLGTAQFYTLPQPSMDIY